MTISKNYALEAKGLCRDLNLRTAFRKAELTQTYLFEALPDSWRTITPAALEVELRNLKEAILENLKEGVYLYVRNEHASKVDNPALFGTEVANAFPSAAEDIKQAGNCIAAECHTAAVFHLMRAVEWGLRAFCTNMGFKNLKAVKRSGKIKYTPVSHSDWERIINELHDRVDKKIDRLSRGMEKQAAQVFYYSLLEEVKGFKDAWRNHVMHTRAFYADKDTDALLDHVGRFMKMLATKVHEV